MREGEGGREGGRGKGEGGVVNSLVYCSMGLGLPLHVYSPQKNENKED